MEYFKNFLDTSTIHGLSWISSTTKWSRLFWILVVIGGISGAIYLIQESFSSWNKRPITTTIETLPVSDMIFPNVTVCPKRSFLNLNYDILRSENLTFDNKQRDELYEYALDLIQDQLFNELMRNISKVEYPNRYHDWYYGYTQMDFPYFSDKDNQLLYNLHTSAASGDITTENFGDKFDSNEVDDRIYILIHVLLPSPSTESTLILKVEKNTMIEVRHLDKITIDGIDIDADLRKWNDNITNSQNQNFEFALDRKVSEDDLSKVRIEKMPGFKLTWNYLPKIEPKSPYLDQHMIKEFIRFVNTKRVKNLSEENFTKIVKEARISFLHQYDNPQCHPAHPILSEVHITELIDLVGEKLNLSRKVSNTPVENVQNKTLDFAGKSFIYLTHCPTFNLYDFLKDSTKSRSPKVILSTLTHIMKNSENSVRENSIKILTKTMEILKLDHYKSIDTITTEEGFMDNPATGQHNQSFKHLGSKDLQRITNHPVHIIDEDGNLSPTALIPFCEFGGNMSAMGVKIDQFNVPVCNSFKPKILGDQLCYMVTPNDYRKYLEKDDELSLILYINYNEDRQLPSEDINSINEENFVIFESIEPLKLKLGMEFNMNNVKEMKVTDDFLTLDKHVIKCQNDESQSDCSTRKFVDDLSKHCNCLPFGMRRTEKKFCLTKEEHECAKSFTIDQDGCLKKCEGMTVVSYDDNKFKPASISQLSDQYSKYKGEFGLPPKYKKYQLPSHLHAIRIYFHTQMFETIEKDRSSKFVDKLSAIGGTLGLLTGFSIISGIETLYFLAKIGLNYIQKFTKKEN